MTRTSSAVDRPVPRSGLYSGTFCGNRHAPLPTATARGVPARCKPEVPGSPDHLIFFQHSALARDTLQNSSLERGARERGAIAALFAAPRRAGVGHTTLFPVTFPAPLTRVVPNRNRWSARFRLAASSPSDAGSSRHAGIQPGPVLRPRLCYVLRLPAGAVLRVTAFVGGLC